MMSSAYRRQ